MSGNAAEFYENSNVDPVHGHAASVRLIKDILPFVLGKYGIDVCDDLLAVTQDSPHEYDFSI